MEVAVSIVRGKGFGLGVRTSCELMGARHTLSWRTKKGRFSVPRVFAYWELVCDLYWFALEGAAAFGEVRIGIRFGVAHVHACPAGGYTQ